MPPSTPDTQREVFVEVDVRELPVGRRLASPIRDVRGLLLLASGQIVTESFKERLLARNVDEVMLSAGELHSLPGVDDVSDLDRVVDGDRRRIDTAERVSVFVRSPLPFVTNNGPPLLERMTDHGCAPYERERRRGVRLQQARTARDIDEFVPYVVRGAVTDAGRIVSAAERLLDELMADSDCLVAPPYDPGEWGTIGYHSVRTSVLAMAIGAEMGLNGDNVRRIGVAGLVHDWGMARIPLEIRRANRPLTFGEKLELQKHPRYTVDMLEDLHGLPSLVGLVSYQVHERIDGTGYPRGRRGNGIHLFSRILHAADQYVALTSRRPYRPPLSPYAAMRTIIEEYADGAIDPLVLRALLYVTGLFPLGSFVELSDGRIAKVLRSNHESFDKPIVEVVDATEGSEPGVLDLSSTELRVTDALPTPGRDELHYTVHDHGLRLQPHFPRRRSPSRRGRRSGRSRRPVRR